MDRISIRTKLREFGSEVSVVGARYAALSSAHRIRRLIWILFIFGGFGFATFQIADRISWFMERPTSVNLKINSNDSIIFPTVTICNQNRFHKAQVNATDPRLLQAVRAIYPPYPVQPPDYVAAYQAAPDLLTANHSWEDIYLSWAHSPYDTILVARYESSFITNDDFTTVISDAGYCVQFNPTGTTESSHSGQTRGLSLLLFVDQENYMSSDSVSSGFKVSLHPHYETPAVADLGFYLSPGEQTLVRTTVKRVKELPLPYTDCNDSVQHDHHGCVRQCHTDFVYNKCGCRDYKQPGPSSRRVCSPLETECVQAATAEYITGDYEQYNCSCAEPCDRIYYEYGLSSGKFSQIVQQYLEDTYGIGARELEMNYVILDIYLSDLKFEELKVVPAYTVLALLCDVGGALGLVLGSTVLTFFEVGDFILVTAWEACVYRRKTRTVRVRSNDTEKVEPGSKVPVM